MAPKAHSLSALELENQYSALLKESPYVDARSPFILHKCLLARTPSIIITHGAVKTWWTNYRTTGCLRAVYFTVVAFVADC